jgi:outer membrane protein TolC
VEDTLLSGQIDRFAQRDGHIWGRGMRRDSRQLDWGNAMSRKRWIKRILAGVLTVGSVGGCKQQVFLEPADYHDAVMNTLPKGLDTDVHNTILPGDAKPINGQAPADILSPERPARLMTLRECIAIGLEQGSTGSQSPNGFGTKVDLPNSFTGRAVTGSDAIRVFAVDPATQAAELERSLSKFDARWINSLTWQKVDQPTPAQFLSFQNSQDAANLSSTLAKPLPSGGTAAITFSTTYAKFTDVTTPGLVNPNYTPQLQFTLEQPLLRLFGVEANQLAPTNPGSIVLNLQQSGGAGTEGILVSRIRIDQQKAEFDVRINYMLVNIETAYWNLYAAYYNLYAQEEGLRQAFDGYNFISNRVKFGTDPPQNEYQALAQFQQFRRLVYQARGQVLESERQLRGLLGLRSDDGTRIVPIDKPNEAPYRPDFYEAANEAMASRPELLQARQDLKASQLNLLLQKNLRRPDLRVFGQYSITGLGTRLDGPQFTDQAQTIPGNALTNFAANNFNSWTLGLKLDVPIGFRDGNALVREGQLSLARSYYQLRDSEIKVLEFLVQQYRHVIEAHAEIGPAREERKALQIYLGKTKEVIDIGNWNATFYQSYLTVQRDLATAIATEFQAVANYNQALAQFEFAKGTIQQYNNVTVNEGALPPWVQKRAADQIRERTESALKLRERDADVNGPGSPGVVGNLPVGPATGTGMLSDLPPFAGKREPLPDLSVPPKIMVPPDPLDPKKFPPDGMGAAKVPAPRIQAPGGSSKLPTVPTSTVPPTDSATGTVAVPPPGDFFRPSGTLSLPPATPIGPGGSVVTPKPAPIPLPAGTGLEPLPIPPVGSSLPVLPPAASSSDEFRPAGSLPPPPAK